MALAALLALAGARAQNQGPMLNTAVGSSLSVSYSCVNTPSATGITTTVCGVAPTTTPNAIIAIVYASTAPTSVNLTSNSVPMTEVGASGEYSVWYYANYGGSTNVQANFSLAVVYPVLQAFAVANASITTPIDGDPVFNVVTGPQTTFTSAPLTTTRTGDILLASQKGSSATYTMGSPAFTPLSEGEWAGIFPAYYLTPSIGTYYFTGSQVNSSGYANALVAVGP